MKVLVFTLLFALGCGGTDVELRDGNVPDGGLPDSSAFDGSVACEAHAECCPSGSPARVGQSCTIAGAPGSAAPTCSAAGTCVPKAPRECDVASLCCDGWYASDYTGMCNCTMPFTDEGAVVVCSQAPEDNPVDMIGNAYGHCSAGRCLFQ